MASALMDGLIAKKTVGAPSDIICSDLFEPSLEKARSKGIKATKSNVEVCSTATSAIILAVKPAIISAVCKDVVAALPNPDVNTPLIISIAAGVSIDTLEQHLPGFRVCRVMPNTPCLVGQATSGFALGTHGNDSDREITTTIFGSVGIARETKEVLLNAVTGLSGSGPAYVFQVFISKRSWNLLASARTNRLTEFIILFRFSLSRRWPTEACERGCQEMSLLPLRLKQ